MYIPHTTGSAQKVPFLQAFYEEISKAPYHESYISYQIGWAFKAKPIFLLVCSTIYTLRTKGNGLKWEFQGFFWMIISFKT